MPSPDVKADWRDGRKLTGLAIGGLAPIVAALLLVPFREDIDNANLALLLVLVVVLAAIAGGRTAAVLAAITGTMAFDFFLTRPYASMRIESADDVETVIILLAVGLLVGEVAARGRRSRRERERAADAIDRVHRVAAQIAEGGPMASDGRLRTVVDAVVRELIALLQLHDCYIEFAPFQWPLPRLERSGAIEASEHQFSSGGFMLPEYGVGLPVLQAGTEVARLVLLGNPEVSVTLEERVVAVALADQLGSALAMAGSVEFERVRQELARDE
jgi:K+-sensing histidine kinase KdpD